MPYHEMTRSIVTYSQRVSTRVVHYCNMCSHAARDHTLRASLLKLVAGRLGSESSALALLNLDFAWLR